MSMHVEGGDAVKKRLTYMQQKGRSGLKAATLAGAQLIVNEAKIRAPHKTGNLRASLHAAATRSSADSVEVRVGTNLIYAPLQEYGGTIKAKNVKFLRFQGKDKKWHYAKSVTVPAHPYLRPAFHQTKAAVKNEIARILGELRK